MSTPRTDWYQTDQYVSVSFFVKNALAESTVSSVDSSGVLSVRYRLPDNEEDKVHSLQLSHSVQTDKVDVSTKPTRIDVKLYKVEIGRRWNKLEGEDDSLPPAQQNTTAASVNAKVYPSSSQNQKNWDKIAKDIEDDKPEGEQALNELFQKIYADGSDETKKAMMKSFSESGGTVLSTNWSEVGKDKVEVKPPDGMEYRKWES